MAPGGPQGVRRVGALPAGGGNYVVAQGPGGGQPGGHPYALVVESAQSQQMPQQGPPRTYVQVTEKLEDLELQRQEPTNGASQQVAQGPQPPYAYRQISTAQGPVARRTPPNTPSLQRVRTLMASIPRHR